MTETLNFIIESLFLGLAIWFVTNLLAAWWLSNQLKKEQELISELADLKKSHKRAKVEEYQGIYYVFDADTDEFIGQGRNITEFADRLTHDMVLQLAEGDPEVIDRFRNSAQSSTVS